MIIVRVYGVVRNNKGDYLLSTEEYSGKRFTKFIGGGLEQGEGTRDCLKREIMEETGRNADILNHLYTTDFYLQSAFNPNDQIISIYYSASIDDAESMPLKPMPNEHLNQVLQWVPQAKLHPDMVTFPADKHLVKWLGSR